MDETKLEHDQGWFSQLIRSGTEQWMSEVKKGAVTSTVPKYIEDTLKEMKQRGMPTEDAERLIQDCKERIENMGK